MRFDEQLHWSEGLFLQPHHLQRMQRLLEDLPRKIREVTLPYAYGWCDLHVDLDALKSRRVVVKHLSAILPDGQELSMPGNCSIAPLTLEFDGSSANSVMIYLRLPQWSNVEPNLSQYQGRGGRYLLREIQIKDENSSDNEIPVMVRSLNASLTADPNDASSFTLLPLCRVVWTVINSSQPSLSLDESYMPPFITVSDSCPLLSMCSELLFQLRSAKNSLISEFSADGFDSGAVTARELLKTIKLKTLSRYEQRLFALLVPERITPFALFLELISLLGELEALDPFQISKDRVSYVHDDCLPVFKRVLERIRSILLQGGVSSALSFPFKQSDLPYLELQVTDERVFAGNNLFLALSYTGDLAERIRDVEDGDNFRLLDKESFGDRIRGVKLVHLRYPPQYLPSLVGVVWFKVMCDESERMWSLIAEEKSMIIDCVHDLFPNLKATLYVNVEEGLEVS